MNKEQMNKENEYILKHFTQIVQQLNEANVLSIGVY